MGVEVPHGRDADGGPGERAGQQPSWPARALRGAVCTPSSPAHRRSAVMGSPGISCGGQATAQVGDRQDMEKRSRLLSHDHPHWLLVLPNVLLSQPRKSVILFLRKYKFDQNLLNKTTFTRFLQAVRT